MIETNKWYRFLNQNDRDLFIALAMKKFEFVTHELSNKVRAAQMLKVNTEEEGYAYFNYRTTYSPKYNNNASIFSAAASLSGAGIKEVNMCGEKGCVGPLGPLGPSGPSGPCGIPEVGDKFEMYFPPKVQQDPMVDIFDKWARDKRAESRKAFEDGLNTLLLDSTVGRSLKHFITMAQIHDKGFTMDPTNILRPSMLSEAELGEVEKLKKAYQSDCDVFEKEAFVTRNLLMAAETYEQKYDILKRKGVIE